MGSQHDIDILDPSPICQCRFSDYVRRWYRCPSFRDEPRRYLDTLLQRLRAERYDVLLPTHEQIYLIARFREVLEQHVALAVPSFAAVDRMMSKASFARLLLELDLPQPKLTIVSSRAELEAITELPQFLKLDFSTAGQGVRLVRDRAELSRTVDEFEQAGWLDGSREILVQRPAVGRKASIKSVFRQGELVAAHCGEARAFGVGGSSVAEVSVSHPTVVAQIARLGSHLQWHGGMAVEYFYDAEQDLPQYLECNPRMGETGSAWMCGTNLTEYLVQVSLGVELPPRSESKLGTRTHQAFLVLLAMAVAGQGRRELLAEINKRFRRRGIYHDSHDVMTRPGEDRRGLLPALWVTSRLLLNPSVGKRIVQRTVDNYSLSSEAVEVIRQLA